MTGRLTALLACGAVLLAGNAPAQAPETSLRPQARPGPAQEVVLTQPHQAATETRKGLFQSLRPLLRPDRIREAARGQTILARKEAVCGDPAIRGVAIGRVQGKIRGCGIENAVKLRSVSGITLSQQAVVDCTTARTLRTWIDNGLKPALGNRGGGVVGLKVAAHYACRTRNSQKGARISEHGKGRAIDISGFVLRDGSEISVLRYWGKGSLGRILREIHAAACGPFGTVLGPDADRFHRDHFHLDTARYRGGAYCR